MKFLFTFFAISMTINLLAQPALPEESLRQKADELAHLFIIVDGHVDLPYRLSVKNFRLTK
ncbi:MAG: membrane dipeptidase, partial [Bacteroidetes bacterium]|nr:membrane dipeptidase [Bacteroidota bacterium]